MTIKSWCEEHYPTSANEFCKNKDALAAIKHTLRKWQGARVEVLDKHNLKFTRGSLLDENNVKFGFSAESCSLCELSSSKDGDNRNCEICPFHIVFKRACTTNEYDQYSDYSEFGIWYHDGDPEPMIKSLEEVLKFYLETKEALNGLQT